MGTDDQEGRPRLIAYVPHLNTGALAVDGTSAYLATAAGIIAVDLLRAKTRVVVPLGGGTGVSCLAVDATHLYVLTSSPEGGALVRVPLGGGAEEVLVERMRTASSFALYGAHLFWVN